MNLIDGHARCQHTPPMKITDRHRWMVIAGVASFAASQLASQLMSSSWELASGDEPPEDPADRDFDWKTALLFGAATGAVVGVAEVLGRGGAKVAWKQAKGRKPPAKRR
jgi:hypothetical protein